MADVRTQNRRRMQARAEASGKKPNVPKAKVPAVRPSTSVKAPNTGGRLTGLGEPSGGPLARRASTDIAERAIRGESPGIKDIGSGRSAGASGARGLPAPSAAPAAASRGISGLGRLAGGIGLAAYSPAVGEGSDKPQNYPGEGLKARAAFPQGSAESSIPAPKKATPKPAARKSSASSDDDFMSDLRASAARMKDATSDMASKTGRMKGAMEEFQSAADDASEGYKRGGRVGGRGDGKAIRGRTKGRFI